MPTDIPSFIKARIDEEIRLELESNSGAGYEWSAICADGGVELVKHEVVAPATGLVGASAREVLVLRPRVSGKHHVTLRLKRRWETSAVREVDVEIGVQDSNESQRGHGANDGD